MPNSKKNHNIYLPGNIRLLKADRPVRAQFDRFSYTMTIELKLSTSLIQ